MQGQRWQLMRRGERARSARLNNKSCSRLGKEEPRLETKRKKKKKKKVVESFFFLAVITTDNQA